VLKAREHHGHAAMLVEERAVARGQPRRDAGMEVACGARPRLLAHPRRRPCPQPPDGPRERGDRREVAAPPRRPRVGQVLERGHVAHDLPCAGRALRHRGKV
jgi:hypothetical protein